MDAGWPLGAPEDQVGSVAYDSRDANQAVHSAIKEHDYSALETSVARMEQMFQRADANMDCLTLQVKCQLTLADAGKSVDRVRIVEDFNNVKDDYAALVKEAEALKRFHMEAMQDMKQKVFTLSAAVERLLHTCGMDAATH